MKKKGCTLRNKNGESDRHNDGGKTQNGVWDANTRDADTYSSPKIESNYRQGQKERWEEERRKEGVSDEHKCVVEEENRRHEVSMKGEKNHTDPNFNCLIYSLLNIDSTSCHMQSVKNKKQPHLKRVLFQLLKSVVKFWIWACRQINSSRG